MEKKDIKSLLYDELIEEFIQAGEKAFRGKQVYDWIHKKLENDFEHMTNLPKNLRKKLESHFFLPGTELIDSLVSKDGETTKYLFRLYDNRIIESVLMKYHHGNSVCISSQAGCRMGCRFCASTLGGLERNLLPSEMLGQIYEIQRLSGERVSNVVVMGTGEPLDNYNNLLRFIRILSDEHGLNISQRNITVSTCGLVEKIRQLEEEEFQITLAISLHAPNDELRKTLMPVAEKYSVKEIIDACYSYYNRTGRRITFEYCLIEGVNDGEENAMELYRLVRGLNCHINLIPVNPIKERHFRQTTMKFIQKFKNILEKNRINVTIRREMGADINAACGQLRKRYMDDMQKGD